MSCFFVLRQSTYAVMLSDSLGLKRNMSVAYPDGSLSQFGELPERVPKLHQLHPNVHVAAVGPWPVTGHCFDTFSRQVVEMVGELPPEGLVANLGAGLVQALEGWLSSSGRDVETERKRVDIRVCVLLTGELVTESDRERGWNTSCYLLQTYGQLEPEPVQGSVFWASTPELSKVVATIFALPALEMLVAQGPFAAAQVAEAVHSLASRLSHHISEECNILLLGGDRPTVLKGTAVTWPADYLKDA